MNLVTLKTWAESLRPPLSLRRAQVLYSEGRIKGAQKPGRDVLVPHNAPDPRKPAGRPPTRKTEE